MHLILLFVAATGYKDMERFGLGVALPATTILDQQGEIAFRIIGILKRKDLTRRLDYLLSGKQGKVPEPLINTRGEEDDHALGGVAVEGASMVPRDRFDSSFWCAARNRA